MPEWGIFGTKVVRVAEFGAKMGYFWDQSCYVC